MEPSPEHQDFHHENRCPAGCPAHRRRHGFLAGIFLGIVVAGAVGFGIGLAVPSAVAGHGPLGFGSGHGHGGPFGHGPGPGGEASAEGMRDHAGFAASWALHRLGATVEQQDKVLRVIDGAVDSAMPLVERHRANRDALRALLRKETLDRGALEALRAEEVAIAADLSKVLAAALADGAEALTPAQRGELLDRLDRFRHPH